jgi:hypothetical protein
MKAFEVFLNGNKLCTSGVGNLGVLSAVLTWVRREGENTETKMPDRLEEELTLNVAGLISPSKEHVSWAQRQLTLGDEICIRIIESDSVDPPRDRKTEDPAEDVKRQQKYVEQMAKHFGWTIQK